MASPISSTASGITKPIEDPSSAELNVGVNEIIDAAIESIRTGKAVSLKP